MNLVKLRGAALFLQKRRKERTNTMPQTLARFNIDRYVRGNKIRRYQYELTREETQRGTEDILRPARIVTLQSGTKRVLKTERITGTTYIPEHVRREVRQRVAGKI